MKAKNGKPMNFHLWHSYAQLLVTFEDLIVEAGITSKKDRDQILRTVVGTPRSTARRHRQIFEALDRIPNPEEHRSWKSLLRAAVEVGVTTDSPEPIANPVWPEAVQAYCYGGLDGGVGFCRRSGA